MALFGGQGYANTGGGSLFGAPAVAPAGGLFGAPAVAPAGGLFGAPAAAPAGGLFGAPAAAAANGNGGLFGGGANGNAGHSGGAAGGPDQIVQLFEKLSEADQKATLRRLQRFTNPTLVEETFWLQEANGALMSRNMGCFAPDTMDALRARARTWLDMLPVNVQVNAADSAKCTDEAALRIFQRDADRTFDVVWRKDEFVDLLKLCWIEIKDYQQGLGYILAFLFMLLDKVSCARIALSFHHSPKHSNGYFAAQPDNFVRDARVMHRMLEVLFPDIVEHFKTNGLVFENCNMYCVKWFSGLGLHFLPYADMFRYFELYLQHGFQFSVRFTLAYIEALRADLLKCKGTNEVSMLLRNEQQDHKKAHPMISCKGKDFFNHVMDRAMSIDLQGRDLLAMREKEGAQLQGELLKKREKMAQMAEESDGIEFSDDD